MHPYYHAVSSAKRHGGVPEDYLALHQWFDSSKSAYADWRHRALRHHALGIFWAEEAFGPTILNSAGRQVPTRVLGEQHVREDLGWIPSVQDWLHDLPGTDWRLGRRTMKSRTLYDETAESPAVTNDEEDYGQPEAPLALYARTPHA